MLAALDMERRQWLFESVAATGPEHAWLAALSSPHSTQGSSQGHGIDGAEDAAAAHAQAVRRQAPVC